MNAKMVDFGGWDMPLHYGSQLDEHHKVRRDAGMFDVSHMLAVDIKGEGARDFLRRLVANNVDKLVQPGKALYTCMLNPQGGVIDDLIIYYLSESHFRMVVNAGTADKDLAWMQAQRDKLAPQLEIIPRRDLAMIAVQGPNARARVWEVIAGSQAATEGLKLFQAVFFDQYFIARTGYTGEDGFEIMLPVERAAEFWKALAAAGVAPAGLGSRDTLRLEAGMNLYGQDMDETASPLESGLGWTVDMKTDREFIGKEALLAAPAKQQLIGLVLLDQGVLRSHQKVSTANGAGRGRNYQRRLFPDAESVHCARACAINGRCGRRNPGNRSRQGGASESSEISVRAEMAKFWFEFSAERSFNSGADT